MEQDSFSDDTTFELTKMLYKQLKDVEQKQRLDIDNLDQFKQQNIKPLYPHKQIEADGKLIMEKYTCKQYCCQLHAGTFCFGKSTPPDEVYEDFGLGFCLYVKFLKHISLFLIIISILAFIPFLFYYLAGGSSGFAVTDTYQNFIYSGTAGIISEPYNRCAYSFLESQGTKYAANFQINCITGDLTILGAVYTTKTLNNVHNCRLEKDNFKENIKIAANSQQINCNNENTQCSLITDTNESEGIAYQYVSLVYECLNNQYPLGDILVSQPSVIYVAVSFDLIIIVCIITFLFSEKRSERRQIKDFQSRQLSAHDFAVKIHGFDLNNLDNQIDQFLRLYSTNDVRKQLMEENKQNLYGSKQFEKQASKSQTSMTVINKQNFIDNIVQIKIPESDKLRQAISHRRKSYKNIYNFLNKNIFKQGINVQEYKSSQQFIKNCFNNDINDARYIEYKKMLKEKVINFVKSRKVNYDLSNKQKASIYIVMRTLQWKKNILKSSHKGFLSDKLKVGGKQYRVEKAAPADMIIWENHHKNTCIRMIIVWIITLGICFGSYLLVALAIYQRDQLLSRNSFDNDCEVIYTVEDLNTLQVDLKDSAEYIGCFCEYHIFNLNINAGVTEQCSSWASQYALFIGIPILISLGIVLYNLIVSRLYKIMTKFQGHKTVTAQLYSYIVKRAFLLIMNMGLILTLVKLQHQGQSYDNLYFLFIGTYQDITSDWYLQIGVIIILTLSFNIFLPVFQMLFYAFLKWVKRMWDKKCCFRKTSQKTKQGYIKLYSNNHFPIEQRYADIIAILAITLSFSSVMPLVYFIAFLSLGFMFICDKLLLFKVYQRPINYSSSLQQKIFKTIYFFLMVHFVVAIFLLTESQQVESGNTKSIYEIPGNNERLQYILQIPYIIPYIAFFCILFIFAIFKETIVRFIMHIISHHRRTNDKYQDSQSKIGKYSIDYLSILSKFQLNQLKMAVQKQRDIISSHGRGRSHLKIIAIKASTLKFDEQKYHTNLIQNVCQTTLQKIQKFQAQIHNNDHRQGKKVKLIGMVGYEQMFNEATFDRQKKIKQIDHHFGKLLGKQIYERKKEQGLHQSGKVMEINLDEL